MKNLYSKLCYSLAGAAALTSLTSSSPKQSEPEGPYNIVYIMTDDHTAQMMSCYDRRYIQTPNLDRIAQDGVRFTNSFVANSLSGPSRACMLTGMHSHANGFADNNYTTVFDNTQRTFPKLLQQAGYQTAVVGKWHLKSEPVGFDYWEVVPDQGDYYNPRFITPQGMHREDGYISDLITDKSLKWLDNRDEDKPFCILIHHKACHREWQPDLKYLNEYEDVTFPIPDTFYDTYDGRQAAQEQEMTIAKDMRLVSDTKIIPKDEKAPDYHEYAYAVSRLTPEEKSVYDEFFGKISEDFYARNLQGNDLAEWKFQRYMRDYAKVVKSVDDNVGRVLDYLEANGLMDNTLVVYTSDQGFFMGEHGWFDKRFMYEESFRTPLVMNLPEGFDRKGDVDEMVQNIDYAPTFLELAGLPVPEDIHGESFLPLLKGKKPANWRKSLYYHFYEYPAVHMVKRHYGVRTDRYKLIHYYNDIDSWELFDLHEDPQELNNLYGKPEYKKITKKLIKELERLQKQYDDPIRFSEAK